MVRVLAATTEIISVSFIGITQTFTTLNLWRSIDWGSNIIKVTARALDLIITWFVQHKSSNISANRAHLKPLSLFQIPGAINFYFHLTFEQS